MDGLILKGRERLTGMRWMWGNELTIFLFLIIHVEFFSSLLHLYIVSHFALTIQLAESAPSKSLER
jgi:hypothetical protein